jgi:hypothetical protein
MLLQERGVRIPRIFGRQILDAHVVGKRSGKVDEIPVKVAMGYSDCEVYDMKWQKCFHAFAMADARAELGLEGLIRIFYTRRNQTFEFVLRHEKVEMILNAFNGQSCKRQTDAADHMTPVTFVDILSFACDINRTEGFQPYLEAQARRRTLFLTSSAKISEATISAIAVEFKMRFPQIEPENWGEAFEVLWYEFVGFTVSLWSQCLKSAIEPHSGPNSGEYFRRLVARIAGIIGRGADVFQVDRCEFLLVVWRFLQNGDPSRIPAAARLIMNDVELKLGNIRKRWLLQLTDLFEFCQLFSAAITIGQAMEGEKQELADLSGMLCTWALSKANNHVKGPKFGDFRNALEKLAVAVLKATDSQRYGPDFHCTLALWKLSELVKASDICE